MENPLLLFVVKLSRQMGIPVKRMLNEMDSEEISLYLAAERISPMDDPWQRNALNCYVTARAAGVKCKESDFVPRYRQQQTPEQMAAILRAMSKRKRE